MPYTADIVLFDGDTCLQFEEPAGTLNAPKDIFSDTYAITAIPQVSSSSNVDITDYFQDSGMVSEITHDSLQIFITDDGRVAIRLDRQLIKILD